MTIDEEPPGRAEAELDPQDEQHALELWQRRYDLSADDLHAIAGLPFVYRATFEMMLARRAGRRDVALDLASRALPLTAPVSRWRGHLLRLQATVLADLLLVEQAVATNTAAQDIARTMGDDVALASLVQDLSTYPHQSDDRVKELLTQARALAVTTDAEDLVILIDYNLAWWLKSTGASTDSVIDAFASAEARARSLWPDLADEARAQQVQVAARTGDLARARTLAQDLPDETTVEDEETRAAVAIARAWVLADEGRVSEAEQTLTSLLDAVTEDRRVDLLTALAEVLAHAGRYAQAWRSSQDLVRAVRENAQSLGSAQARALEIWYETHLAHEASRREQARADQLERALAELQSANDRIREMSQHDALTGLYNRGHLLDLGERLMALATPGRPLGVALIDIDDFKAINDGYGHRAGDHVLRQLAAVARAVLHPDDVVARYGGEEFVVLRRPGADACLVADLGVLADRLRALDDTDGGPVGITLSAGVTYVDSGALEAALHTADLLMYAAKRDGGDAVRTDGRRPEPAS